MKTIPLLLLAFTLTVGSVIAQDREPGNDARTKLNLGFKFGANISNIYDADEGDIDTYPNGGFAGGGYLAIPIGRYIGIQPEVLYSQRGFQVRNYDSANPYNLRRTTNYLDIPVLFAFKPSRFFTLLAGPQFSYLLSRRDEFVDGSTSAEQETIFRNENIRKNTFCATGGFDITIRHFVIGARAGWDVLQNNGDGSASTIRYKNVWYQGTLGFRIY